ncbi:hypothetical protein HaLaN_15336 [Haematococcus lacustris]|uniref:Uncharacterized protein n=1 Tax=Haematococcus lacustris TaxID=44745 RepID=A0A699ZHG6_HAELA|nr:hypothetical protein HaLaN_15336 [Haematococcus lacustris]
MRFAAALSRPMVSAALQACTAAELFCLAARWLFRTKSQAVQRTRYKLPCRPKSTSHISRPLSHSDWNLFVVPAGLLAFQTPSLCPRLARNSDMARSQRAYDATQASQRKGPFGNESRASKTSFWF